MPDICFLAVGLSLSCKLWARTVKVSENLAEIKPPGFEGEAVRNRQESTRRLSGNGPKVAKFLDR